MEQEPTRSDPTSMLESMMLIRAFAEKHREHQVARKAPGAPTCAGQEAAAVGVVSALGPEDLILTNHRSSGHLLARGADPGRLFAEMAGRTTGYCKGKSGPGHISVKELGVILTSTIVGGSLSMAPGVGLSRSMLGGSGIVACFFGDGAACEGSFHESVNLAAVWDLPILYVCENNQWQGYVHRRETMLVDHVSTWASSYGVASRTVDATDLETVLEAAREATIRVRETRKPFLLETYMYRLWGHFEPDDQQYVDPAELATWQQKDPIELYRKKLLDREELRPAELEQLERRVREKIDRASAFALESPFPAPEEATTDVYA